MKPSHLLMRHASRLRPGVDRAPATLLRTKPPLRLESSIKVPAPESLSYLPFQRAGIEFLSQCEAALLAGEMGLGKTVEIAGLLNYLPEIVRVLVVCPASLKINWQRELARWLVDSSRSIAIWNGGRKPDPSADVVILNYELLGKFEMELKRAPWDLLVFDEAHFLKTPEAQRTKAAKRLVPYARRRVCLTGTPMLGRPCELWSLLNLLDPAEWPNFYAFAHRYCDPVKTSWGWDFRGTSNIPELRQRLHHSGLWLRRRKRDVLTQLPRIRRQTIALEIGRSELLVALSEELAEELGTKVEDFSELLDPERIPFELMSRIRRVTGTLKTEEALKFIKEESEGYDSKTVVFGHHRNVLEKLAGSLENAVLVTGDTPLAMRQARVDAFQNDPAVRFFVGSTSAMGVGVDLTASSQAIFVEFDWTPGVLSQAESRLHRLGQSDSVLVQYLVIAGSIDEKILAAVRAKMRLIDATIES
jgi:SWI/SNF-related matrix-associated actin-dependent regulator 1 of chromatin subfamily A